jgi:glycosyltransferase involved in cell wall biosynthesis
MTICYFGIYDKNYPRNRIIIKGLKLNGINVIEVNDRTQGIKKFWYLFFKHWKIRNKYDVMIVGFPGQIIVPFAKLITKKKIIFDAFTSLYDSLVFDRQTVKPRSLQAKYYWFLDWMSCKLVDIVLLDTNAHIDYFVETFKIKKNKFVRIFVGSDEAVFKPTQNAKIHDFFLVHFHGSYIPLQGVAYILEAAKMLENENIRFNIIGSKIKEHYKNAGYKNINFIDNVKYEELSNYISLSDVSLGIFGNTDKAKRVIPNKVFEAMAVRKIIITADTPAIKELFTDRKNILLCDIADANDLVQKIKLLKNDKISSSKIIENCYQLFLDNLIPEKIVKNLIIKLNLCCIK